MNSNMALAVSSPGSPSSTLYTTIQLSDSDDFGPGKRRRKRTIITSDQLGKLEGVYRQEQWPNRERKEKLAKEIGMSTHFVNIWFQNKRSRMKKMAQEEVELAAMRKKIGGSEESQSEKEDVPNQPGSASNETAPVTLTKTWPSPARAGPVPIAPLFPKSPLVPAKTKANLSDLKLSPQVVCVKFPRVTTQSSAQPPSSPEPGQSTPKKAKLTLEESPRKSNPQQKPMSISYPAVILPKVTEYVTVTSTGSGTEYKYESPERRERKFVGIQQATSPAAQLIQKFTQAQQNLRHVQQQQAALQNAQPIYTQPQIRFATSSSSTSAVPVAPNSPEPVRKVVVQSQQVPTQENIPSSSTAYHDSHLSLTPPAPPNYSLFECLVAMAAVEEGGGIVQKQDPIYDVAVNSALYGIKVEEDMVLTHDRQKGLRFSETES